MRSLRIACSLLAFAVAASILLAEPNTESPFTAADRSYWAFQPIKDVAAPEVGESHPIDAFLAAKLKAKGLEIAPRADKVTLIRRASFDLTGLPPTPEEVAAFVADESPEAFAKVVDRLLDSPHYGERWARHWLDLARYAESNGFKSDETRPNAWRYRDYVIRSFNSDKPYDRFVAEQIAGDELWPNDTEARLGTGFNRNYPDESNAANLVQRRAELLQDVTDAVGATFMGLTVGCAKCHNHKFDPILQKDYYRLQAFFAATADDDEVVLLSDSEYADYKQKYAVWDEATRAIRDEMESMVAAVRRSRSEDLLGKRLPETRDALRKPEDQLTAFERQMVAKHLWQMGFNEDNLWKALKGEKKERYLELKAQLDGFENLYPGDLPKGMGIKDLGVDSPSTHVLSLANYAVPKEEVQPGFLSILDPSDAAYSKPANLDSTGRRSALAKWLIDPENPLTSRVMANRIWHYHFGRGIVATPSDFGRMGQSPTHPELLDWLAKEFVRQDWSVKQMHRLIMTSKAYQQSSDFREDAAKADGLNRLFWRFEPQRLEGEIIRDSMLAVSGALNSEVGGPSVFPPLPLGMPEPRGGWEATLAPEQQNRRSVYIFVRRNSRYPMMQSFDMPDTHETCARRDVTTTAPQALAMLNDSQTIDWARTFAGRVLEKAGQDRSRQVEEAYRLAYQRDPDSWEKDTALTFFDQQGEVIAQRAAAGEKIALPDVTLDDLEPKAAATLVDFCHALLNSNEFVYRN